MSIKEIISQDPYFDDFDEDKKFYRILFRPGYAVQARELTQMQTLLQHQIQKFGEHVFKEGSMVIPGYINFDTNISYVKVENDSLHTDTWLENNIIGNIVQNGDGIKALVLEAMLPFGSETSTILFIKYLNANETVSTFDVSETLTETTTAITFTTIAADAVGKSSMATIGKGVYFLHGHFVLVDEQKIVLEPFSNTPSYRVGLTVVDSVKTPDDDNSLNDNATGSPNFAAPGAHRLHIDATLTKRALDTIGESEEEDFVELLRVVDGEAQSKVDSSDYSILEKTLARRTYDESGNYTVDPFIVDVVEHASDNTKLTLNVDPGIAYVQGYEIRTIAKNQVDINKARETDFSNNATVDTSYGNYVRVTQVYGMPDFTEYSEVNLYDDPTNARGSNPGSTGLIGTARVRGIEYQSGDPAETTGIFKLYLFDINTNDGESFENVKYIYGNSTDYGVFTCRIKSLEIPMDGFLKAWDSAVSDELTGGATKWLTNPDKRLVAGDWIYIPDLDVFAEVNTTPTDDITLEVTTASSTAIDTAISGTSFSNETYSFVKVISALEQTRKNSLIWRLPQQNIETIRGEILSNIDTTYSVAREFDDETISSAKVTVSCNTNETFVDYSINDYIVTVVSGGWTGVSSGNTYVAGDIISADDYDVTFPSSTQAQFAFDAVANTSHINLKAGVTKTQGTASQEKSKTVASQVDHFGSSDENLTSVTLSQADIYSITKITMSANFSTAAVTGDTDITDRYILDDGQRDNFYDLGSLQLKPDATQPTGRIRVEYNYFEHGGNGNYFSVDSYGIDYENIPTYISPETGEKFYLRNCLDFRPKISSDGETFDNSTGSLTELPITSTRLDFHYYLNRIDKLYLTRTGIFKIIEGVPALIPNEPEDPDDGMVLYKLNVRAYTVDPDDIILEFVENKRYTMRDIGKLERRIENLEYYTSLSLLEKETENLIIKDSEGLDRFKNGFVVDPFTGHGVGDVLSGDYRCSIDFLDRECRPLFVQNNVNLIEYDAEAIRDYYRDLTGDASLPTPSAQSAGSNYQVTGDLVTLPYTEAVMINQPVASNTVNVNPFAVFNFWGLINLSPSNDQWKDTKRLPDRIIHQEGNYDSVKNVVEGYGTIWNEWETQWSATSSTSEILSQTQEIANFETFHRDINGNIDSTYTNVQAGELGKWPYRWTTVSRVTNTNTTQQSRTGVRLKAIPRTITRDLGDKVVNIAYIPFIRTREVQFQARGLKPNTRVYAFFDDVDVNSYCSPWSDFSVPESYNSVTAGDDLITDASGDVSGTFKIPNDQGAERFGSVSFKTGQRIFRLTDRSSNDDQFTTIANANYTAQGIQETKEKSIISTRVADVVSIPQTETRLLSDSSTNIDVQQSPWIDPIAQSFLVNSSGGAFITSLDIFVENKDDNIPLRVQIREMVNGYPAREVLPFGDVTVSASDVHTNVVTNGILYIDGAEQVGAPTSDKFTATNIAFPSPVYLKDKTEYAIIVLSNSNNYTLWIATVGQVDPNTGVVYKIIGTDRPVTEQPYGGSFFKSQNASTWTADQYVDMMFKMYQADFETSTSGIFIACNDPNDIERYTLLDSNPIQTKSGSNKIRINHLNHGYAKTTTEMLVEISGAVDTNGIPASEINGIHDVVDADLYSYTIVTSTTAATSSGFGGGNAVYASKNRPMDVAKAMINNIVLPDTSLGFEIRTTTRRGVHDNGFVSEPNKMFNETSYVSIPVNENFRFDTPKQILSLPNETEYTTPTFTIEDSSTPSPSLYIRGVLSSSNSNISPVIDVNNMSLVVVGNKLDDPTAYGTNSINYSDIDDEDIISGLDPADITFNGTSITCATGSTGLTTAFSKLSPGKFLELENVPSIASPTKDGFYEIDSVSYDTGTGDATIKLKTSMPGGSTVGTNSESNIVYWNRFISETNPKNGSLTSKYLTRRVALANPSTALRISFGAYKSNTSDITVYYKTLPVDSTSQLDNIEWVQASYDYTPADSSDYNNMKEYIATIDDIAQFNAFAIKIAFSGTNPADVPRIIDLRAIALDE